MRNAFLFPGQGAQKVGMGADFAEKIENIRNRFEEADSILGRSISSLCFEGPQDELTKTQNTQPALFTMESAVADELLSRGITPSYCLGHSLGEYAALYASGVFTFSEGLTLVAKRGELMAGAGETASGSMAAVIGISKEAILEVLEQVEGTVVSANENSPDQTVISGETKAVEEAGRNLKKAGAKRVVQLPVSGAFHSPLMEPVADEFRSFVEAVPFQSPRCPVITNVTADAVNDPGRLRELLIEQLTSPVRWVDSMVYLKARELDRAVEIGPGSVLRGLARKCCSDLKVVPCSLVDDLYSLVG